MSDKPSLYVVEKKEVVILVILFVLVTVLSFTMGVRYGESVGKKLAREQSAAEAEHANSEEDKVGGTLGEERKKEAPEHGEAKDAPKDEHGKDEHAATKDEHGAAKDEHGAAKDEHGKEVKDEHGKETKPEAAAKSSHAEPSSDAPPSREAVEKSSDEYLLNALKEAGVEPPGGKAPGNAKLPEVVKEVKAKKTNLSGSWVIQVGSHPTRSEAESQVRQLGSKKVHAEILAPVKDHGSEWHRVVVGNYKVKRDAEKEAAALKGRGAILSFFVWRLP